MKLQLFDTTGTVVSWQCKATCPVAERVWEDARGFSVESEEEEDETSTRDEGEQEGDDEEDRGDCEYKGLVKVDIEHTNDFDKGGVTGEGIGCDGGYKKG